MNIEEILEDLHAVENKCQELLSNPTKPRKSLRGLWKGLDISEEDIDEARKEMWGDFPRKDI